MEYNSNYDIAKAIAGLCGCDTSKQYDSCYSIALDILENGIQPSPEPEPSQNTYAQFDGSSWFNTGENAYNKMKIESEIMLTGNLSNCSVYGSRYNYTTNLTNALELLIINNKPAVDVGSIRTEYNELQLNKKYKISQWMYPVGLSTTRSYAKSKLEDENGVIGDASQVTTSKVSRDENGNGVPMLIGASRELNISPLTNNRFSGIIYYVNVYIDVDDEGENGTLIHNFVFRDVNGVGKMYDTVTQTYYDNIGSGSITVVDAN